MENIGDLSEIQRKTLQGIWDGANPVTDLPEDLREELAEFYSDIADRNPAGSAQAEFNYARANYLLGNGPNPGRSVNEFADRTGFRKRKRQ